MCGILGMIAGGSRDLPPPEAFQRALGLLAHRGPDDQGIWTEGEVVLGHRRLSILDLSSAGHQPMVSANGRYVVVFNGEIYNFQELRVDLEARGVGFRSHTDTEVLLELFALEGVGAIERLRGMFALAIWDRRERELVLVRDRLGIKPLYYWPSAGGIAFGSELKAIRALPGAPHEVSREAVFGYLSWGSVPSTGTMLEGVKSLSPGTWLRWKAGRSQEQSYWSFPTEARYHTRQDAIDALRPALREAVRLRCVADVPVGAFLSGGIDSSAVVALMRDVGQKNLRTLSIVFPGTELDEAKFAQEVARRYETEHVVMDASEDLVRDSLDSFFGAMDQPSLDGANTFVVSRLARQTGLTVVLSGLGGDEVFGGYASFRRAQMLDRFLRHVPQSARSLAGGIGARLHPSLAKLEAFQVRAPAAVQSYLATRGIFSATQARKLLRGAPPDRFTSKLISGSEMSDRSPFHVTMGLELRWYMHNQLLRDTDVFGMAHGLEIRVPLIDHKVVEIVAATDAAILAQGENKALLREALPSPLPSVCVQRSKMGFTFPFDHWLRTSWRPMVEEQLCGNTAAYREFMDPIAVREVWRAYLAGQAHWSRPWTLYVLARWLS
jgi:asparagine synthase (glutamine-hydrolysing)